MATMKRGQHLCVGRHEEEDGVCELSYGSRRGGGGGVCRHRVARWNDAQCQEQLRKRDASPGNTIRALERGRGG